MQKQSIPGEYRLTYAPFRFLEDATVQPFHLAGGFTRAEGH